MCIRDRYKAMTADQLKNEGIESIMAVYKKDYPKFINVLSGDKHKNVTWSFRYVNPDKAALAYVDGKEGENNSFLIESNVYATGTDGDNQYQTIKGDLAKAIAPNEACLLYTSLRLVLRSLFGGEVRHGSDAFQPLEYGLACLERHSV